MARSATSKSAKGAQDSGAFCLFDPEMVKAQLRKQIEATEPTPLEDTHLAPDRSGAYLIFFVGKADHPYYGRLAGRRSRRVGRRHPIYIGRAKGCGLRDRLRDHLRSITAADENLSPGDFAFVAIPAKLLECSSLEDLLLDEFHPTWNKALPGFGNKPRGASRQSQQWSPWDSLHPGRLARNGRSAGEGSKEQRRLRESLQDAIAGHLEATLPRRAQSQR